jgi:predicted nuclease of restriction endonuclease-like (RecB) superfamily
LLKLFFSFLRKEQENMDNIIKHTEYSDWLRNLKQQIKIGQIKAALSVNSQMIMLYWDLGRQIVEKQEKAKWGSGFIEQLSKDLKEEFPEMTGFSAYNLRFMRIFHKFYSPIWEQPVPKIEGQIMKQLVSQFQNVSNDSKMAQLVQNTQFYENQNIAIVEQLVPKLSCVPWGHHILILKKIKDINQALFYINKTIENNWSFTISKLECF